MTGIYKIQNNITKEVYIGQSTDIEKRWKQHLRRALSDRGRLYDNMRVFGIHNFSIEVLEECEPELLNRLERQYVFIYDSFINGLNLTLGGNITFSKSLIQTLYCRRLNENESKRIEALITYKDFEKPKKPQIKI